MVYIRLIIERQWICHETISRRFVVLDVDAYYFLPQFRFDKVNAVILSSNCDGCNSLK
jgi:hypothetical protein